MIISKQKYSPMRRTLATGLLAAGASFYLSGAYAAAPAAGAVVGNQATATYTDGSNESRTATSNLVETIVKQVAGVDIEADSSKFVAVGGTVYFPHTITNTGNGSDAYDLTDLDAGTGTITFNNLEVYADADLDGIPDNFTPLAVTPAMLAGESYGIVVAAQVPSTVTAGETETLTIEAKSQFEPSILDFNTDTVTVSDNAVIEVTKAMSVSTGPSPGLAAFDVVLTYTNNGNNTATGVELIDVLPAGMSYVANSGRWSGATNVILTDTSGATDDPAGINYSFDTTANPVPGNDIQAFIDSVAPGGSGTLAFQVTVDSDLAPGDINNLANFAYNDGATAIAPVNTNTATYTVLQSASVIATDSEGTNRTSTTDDDGAANDVVTEVDAANQGGTVKFSNIIMNTGNGVDTFELSLSGSTFPAGTSFQFYQADGLTPLTDTNGDGIPDTGPLQADIPNTATDDELEVIIVASLPIGASGNNGGAGYDIVLTSTSVFDKTQSDSVTDHLNEITASTTDLTNAAAAGNPGALDEGQGVATDPAVTTNAIDPGESTVFTLFVNNTSAVADSYDLAFDQDSDFLTPSLPSGWSVEFTDTAGNVLTNTGVIVAGDNKQINATVTTAADQSPGTVDIFFRTLSATTGAVDTKRDAVTTNTVRGIELTTDGAGQVFPGGSQVYPHLIVNNGNIAETAGSLVVANTDPSSGWASIIYHDANNNGVIDPGEPVVDDISDFGGLTAGGSEPLLIKVIAPAGANPGDTNVSTLTATFAAGPSVTAEDITTVITGDVVLNKQQALDANCDGVLDSAYDSVKLQAAPGECVSYQIIATNSGSAPVTDLNINDATPNFTTYETCVDAGGSCPVNAATSGAGVLTTTAPGNGTAGTVITEVTTLNPTETASMTFTVQVNDNP